MDEGNLDELETASQNEQELSDIEHSALNNADAEERLGNTSFLTEVPENQTNNNSGYNSAEGELEESIARLAKANRNVDILQELGLSEGEVRFVLKLLSENVISYSCTRLHPRIPHSDFEVSDDEAESDRKSNTLLELLDNNKESTLTSYKVQLSPHKIEVYVAEHSIIYTS